MSFPKLLNRYAEHYINKFQDKNLIALVHNHFLQAAKINIDFHQADIHSVMRFFAKVGKTNIILSDGIQGKVTMRLEKVHWEEAFLAVLWSQGLMAQSMENIQYVSSIAKP